MLRHSEPAKKNLKLVLKYLPIYGDFYIAGFPFPYPPRRHTLSPEELLFPSVQLRENATIVMSIARGTLEKLFPEKLAVFVQFSRR